MTEEIKNAIANLMDAHNTITNMIEMLENLLKEAKDGQRWEDYGEDARYLRAVHEVLFCKHITTSIIDHEIVILKISEYERLVRENENTALS